jgi:hypothetical protein
MIRSGARNSFHNLTRHVIHACPKETNMAQIFLGLDSSIQSLSAVVIDCATRQVVYDKVIAK